MKKAPPKIKVLQTRVALDNYEDFDHNAIFYLFSVDGVHVRGVHWSGRYDGSAHELATYLHHLANLFEVDFITTTETQQKTAMSDIRDIFGKAWKVEFSTEYAFIYRSSTFKSMPHLKPHTLLFTMIRNVAASWRQMHVGFFNVKHRSLKRRFRFLVLHGPSDIEMGDHFKNNKQSKIAKAGWPKVGRSQTRFGRTHRTAVRVVVGDSNGDHFRDFWLNWFENQLHAQSIWRNHLPEHGTHGARLIDGVWFYNMKD